MQGRVMSDLFVGGPVHLVLLLRLSESRKRVDSQAPATAGFVFVFALAGHKV